MSTREAILTAAANVIREKGLANATTREIAREAGCSEALLYKYFADREEIYLGVLRERATRFDDPDELVGTRHVADNLVDLCIPLMQFYVDSLPTTASVFGSPELLTAWRDGLTAKTGGPRSPVRSLERYLDAEITLGRVPRDVDTAAVAALLCGAAFQAAYFACFDGLDGVPDDEALAVRMVTSLGYTSPSVQPLLLR